MQGIFQVFRTRGIYLDCKELLKDPPRRPPEIHELLALNEEELGGGDLDELGGDGFGDELTPTSGEAGGGDMTIGKGKYGATAESMKSELGKYDYYFDVSYSSISLYIQLPKNS